MSFFDKLKGDIGAEKEEIKKPKVKRSASGRKATVKPEPEKIEEPKKEIKPLENDDSSEEGQLAIDVFETNNDIVVQSTIGGIKAEDLDIAIEDDMVTIRGTRQNKIEKEGKKYFYQECYWGSFMRKVILPEEVDSSKAKAAVKDGILTLTMPKVHRKTKKKIAVEQEE